MDCSMPGLPLHHQLPEFTQTHVHWVSDAIQPSHPLSSPSPRTFNLSQSFQMSQFFASGGLSFSFKVSLEFQLQHQSFQWTLRTDVLYGLVASPYSPRDSQESSPTPQFKASILWCSVFFMVQGSHPHMTTKETIAFTIWTFVSKICPHIRLYVNPCLRLDSLKIRVWDKSLYIGRSFDK